MENVGHLLAVTDYELEFGSIGISDNKNTLGFIITLHKKTERLIITLHNKHSKIRKKSSC